jgi:hypothetical protein
MSRKFIVEIEIENDAFHPLPQFEVARILNTVARKIDQDDFIDNNDGFFLFDSYGNKVGTTKLIEEK